MLDFFPQIAYYLLAYKLLPNKNKEFVISVPSGNFGNLCAGLVAKKMGLPVKKFIAPTNSNDTMPRFLSTGSYEPHKTVTTLANSMDVGNPSNISRILTLYDNNIDSIKRDMHSKSYTDKQIIDTIKELYDNNGYTVDPHTAISYRALNDYLKDNSSEQGIFLATAHPSKFNEVIEQSINRTIELHDSLKECLTKKKETILIPNDFESFKQILMKGIESA